MMTLIDGQRNAARALILREESVLVQRKLYQTGEIRFTLPGGAPELGETLEDGLQRECREEIGCAVEIVGLRHVADYFKPRDTDPPTHRHQVEFLFECRVPETYMAHNGPKPDKHQTDVIWRPLSAIMDDPVFPKGYLPVLASLSTPRPVYLGRLD